MTRINTIDAALLLDEHLIAEWREMPRIVNELKKHPTRFVKGDIPKNYTMGNGHVKFFRDKLVYLQIRHQQLCDEMDLRGINRNPDIRIDLEGLDDTIKQETLNNWTPTKQDHKINFSRIKERFNLRKKAYHLRGKSINSDIAWSFYEKTVRTDMKMDDNEGFHVVGGAIIVKTVKGLLNAMKYDDKAMYLMTTDVLMHVKDLLGQVDIKYNQHDAYQVAKGVGSSKSLQKLHEISKMFDNGDIIGSVDKFGETSLDMFYKMLGGDFAPTSRPKYSLDEAIGGF